MAKSLSLLLKIFLPLAAAAGIGGGSWYIYEETNPTILKAFSKKGYYFSPVSHQNIKVARTFGVETVEHKLNNLLSSKDCSNKFFPGLNWITKGFERTTNEETENKPTISSIPTFTNQDKAYACLVLEIGHSSVGSEGVANWELTLKKGNHGMVLIGYAFDSVLSLDKNKVNYEFRWLAVHLKKEGQQWKSQSGAMWDENNDSNDYSGQKIIVTLDDQKLYEWDLKNKGTCYVKKTEQTTDGQECTGPTKWKYFGLSALWEENKDNKGQEVFEIVQQYFGSKKADIWGHKGFNFDAVANSDDTSSSKGWLSTHSIMPNPEEGWKNTKGTDTQYEDYLQQLYSPFNGKKGTWVETDKFCEKNKNLRTTTNNETVERILSLCMAKK